MKWKRKITEEEKWARSGEFWMVATSCPNAAIERELEQIAVDEDYVYYKNYAFGYQYVCNNTL